MTSVGYEPGVDPTRWPDVAQVPNNLRARLARPVAERLVRRALADLPVRMVQPDGTRLGGAQLEGAPTIVVRHPGRMMRRIGTAGLIGFGESYCAKEWDCDDLPGLIAAFAGAVDDLVPPALMRLRGSYLARQPRSDRPTSQNSRSNVERHYDLSNEMFALFLDPSMSYSAALFEPTPSHAATRHSMPLHTAQLRKIDRLLDQAQVGPGTRLLEIGCGWGELAIRAAHRGATVTAITLSQEQYQLAREKVEQAGLSDRVQIRLTDYREVRGEYDAVVSVEMIEAVGLDFLDGYFALIRSVLAPGGRVALQAITMPHGRVRRTHGGFTWIQKYIFPGGALPSLGMLRACGTAHGLRLIDRRSLGTSYALTLQYWREAFAQQREALETLGFDETFRRMWEFYLGYSEGGFRAGYLDVWQLTYEVSQ